MKLCNDGKQHNGEVDFVIKASDVVVAKEGEFITIIKDGIHTSTRIKRSYEEYINGKQV